jgi:DNA polymerase-3 subunit gamma/tau
MGSAQPIQNVARAAGGMMSEADAAGRLTEEGLDLGATPAPPGAGYRVLARKYRPATFDDLIGQDAMVRTLSNAFETGRIPQAWILTGVRGVGKTTTARILARGLNYELPDGSIKAPTIRMPVLGVHCAAIMESRHVDVLEMDAASNRGIDDIRQIIDSVRYAPVNARYKVYILDEVHMLTPPAFNALLKTLEEPPPHTKFIFATTEIREVPITVLSRCQRFDLRRVESEQLVSHLEGILAKERLTAEPEALALIARAAEGSVRDSLSLLDQAISHGTGSVRAADVRQMLGLADQSRIIELFDALMRGDIARALSELRDQYDSGADPLTVLAELAAFTHFVTRVKIVPAVAEDRALAEIERKRGRDFATGLSMRALSRTWQMLLKGIAEVKEAARPIAAAEMVLVRIAYAADLPSPEDVIRSLGERSQHPAAAVRSLPNLPPPGGEGEASGALAAPASYAPHPLRSPLPHGGKSIAHGVAPLASSSTSTSAVADFDRSIDSRQQPRLAGRGEWEGSPPPRDYSLHGAEDRATEAGRAEAQASARQMLAPPSAMPPSATPPARDPVDRSAEAPAATQSRTFARFSDLIASAAAQRDLQLKTLLERDVRLVRFEDGKLEIALEPSASKALVGDLGRRLAALTGRRWMVAVSAESGAPTVRSQLNVRREEFKRGVKADPLVQSVLARFPGAEIVAVRRPEPEALPPAAAVDDEAPPEMPGDDGESVFGAHRRSGDMDDNL